MPFRSDFLHTLETRGFIHQVSEPERLDDLARTGRITAYIGFDATAASLHAGSLVQIMMLRWLQKTGHTPIVLMGGGTTKIGDPSGKDEARKVLSGEEIDANIVAIGEVFGRFLEFGDGKAMLRNNDDWLSALGYIPLLRDIGRHFTINRMLTFDSVKLRLEREQPLTFLEFNYMILQAYDFVELFRREGCVLQMGGSDQWGNIVNGIDLGRRVAQADLFALTTPLLTTSGGAKMGKTASGAVWLRGDMLSPYDYWQFFRNTSDADVPRFLKLFTELPLPEIGRLASLRDREINEAKKILADEATALLHGRAAADEARGTAQDTFEEGEVNANLPFVEISMLELSRGMGAQTAFLVAGLVQSTGEARRHIQGGGLRVNDEPVTDERAILSPADVTAGGAIKLSVGRKRHILLRPK